MSAEARVDWIRLDDSCWHHAEARPVILLDFVLSSDFGVHSQDVQAKKEFD
jgi:hypothetical protein